MSQVVAQRLVELTEELQLTHKDVGEIIGASPRTIARWQSGTTEPRREPGKRLLELAYVAEAAREIIHEKDVNWWMFEPNSELEGDSPADRIRDGRYRDVLGVIEALAEGVFS